MSMNPQGRVQSGQGARRQAPARRAAPANRPGARSGSNQRRPRRSAPPQQQQGRRKRQNLVRRTKVRRADLVIAKVDTWSVAKLVFLLSIAVGIAAIKVGKPAEPVLAFAESFLAIIQKVLWWIIRLAPIGTAALIAHAVAEYGWGSLGSLGKFVIAIYIGLALVIGVIYPLVLKFNGLSITQFFRKIWPVTSLGFVTRSSMGVMPVTEQTAEKELGVPRSYASFAVPLGATTKMDGCAAVYPAVAAIFVAQFYGVDLNITDYLLIVFVSVIGSAATAGTTGATVMLTLTLSTLGLPLEGVGLLLAVEPIVDMGRTAVNVTGQALIPLVVSKREGILETDTFAAPKKEPALVS